MNQTIERPRLEERLARHAARAIDRLKRLDSSFKQSGDSRLENVWEEYKVQVQSQESLFISFYCETIRRIIEDTVGAMRPQAVAALWRLTPEADEYGEESSGLSAALLREAVEGELLRRLERMAADEPLPPGVI